MTSSKPCTKCNLDKPLTEFYKNKQGYLGLRSECKTCWNKRTSQYYVDNREAVIVRTSAYNKNNRESINAWRSKRHRLKPGIYLQAAQQRRGLKSGNGTYSITKKELVRLLSGSCFYCGSTEKLTLDHVVPLIRGGRHSIGNLIPACSTCNKTKNRRTIMEWKIAKVRA